jgi:hypothetical protein
VRPPPPSFQPLPDHVPDAPSALLSAFAGGGSLLAAIVLSEALAPPIALRRDGPRF